MSESPDTSVIEPNSAALDAGVVVNPAELDLGYQVDLDSFSGPLDLLLYLVRRAEVDVADIPIATIADQFIAAISSWADMDLEAAGDFILMAATLLEIKSRLVVPPEEKPTGQEGEAPEEEDLFDPRAGLIQQLLSYRRFKEAMQLLTGLEEHHAQRCSRQLHEIIPEDPEEADGIDLANCDPGLLFTVWEKILAKINGLGPRTVINDDVPLEAKIHTLIDAMRAAREARLSWLFDNESSRIGRVGTLMATLECVRQRFIEALQHEQYGEVFLRYREDQERETKEIGALAAEPPEEPKRRRRRLPLVTWQPTRGQEPLQSEIELDDAEQIEEVVETDEQRFMRELEETCAVEAVLSRSADIDAGFAAFIDARRLAAEGAVIAPPTTDQLAALAADEPASAVELPSAEAPAPTADPT